MKNYIKHVRKYDKSRLMTQAQLAKKAGISRTTLAMIENEKADPDGRTIAKIAKALNYPVYALFPDFESNACEWEYEQHIWRCSKLLEAIFNDPDVTIKLYFSDGRRYVDLTARGMTATIAANGIDDNELNGLIAVAYVRIVGEPYRLVDAVCKQQRENSQ